MASLYRNQATTEYIAYPPFDGGFTGQMFDVGIYGCGTKALRAYTAIIRHFVDDETVCKFKSLSGDIIFARKLSDSIQGFSEQH